jgi:hypothetical protein
MRDFFSIYKKKDEHPFFPNPINQSFFPQPHLSITITLDGVFLQFVMESSSN